MTRFWKLGFGLTFCVGGFGCGEAGEALGDVAQADGVGGTAPAAGGCSTTGPVGGGGTGPAELPVVFRQGASVLGSAYSGATDAMLDKRAPTTNNGGLEYCAVRGGSKSLSCLMKWNLSALPPTTIVTRACVELYIDDPSASSFEAYEALRNWNENDATWNKANFGTSWEVPGALGATDHGAISVGTILPTFGSGVTIRVPVTTALVQKWVTNQSENRGLLFGNASSADGVSFEAKDSRFPQLRPALLVFDGPGGL